MVWSGDILLMYALVGFLLLIWARTPARRLWKWGLVFYLAPIVLIWLGAWGISMALQSPQGPEMMAEFEAGRARLMVDIAAGEAVYRDGSWLEASRWRLHEIWALYGTGGAIFFIPTVLGMFLIGASFARAGIFHSPDANRRVFVRMMVIGYAVGIPCAVYLGLNAEKMDMIVLTIASAQLMTVASVASLALCLAYIGTLMVLLRGAKTGAWLLKLAPAGRMALTNYLTHSVVFTLLFYGYGFGLYGEYARFATTLMALTLYAGQVWFSGWWLARHRMGPMEWLWRTATYGRRL
jgi:uncharacterized protein